MASRETRAAKKTAIRLFCEEGSLWNPRPTPYAARPVVPAGPTQEELDAEYIRICQSYDPTSDEWTVDRYNRRWIMCTVCGRIKQDAQMSYYGGKGGANRGVCADCSRNGRS